MSGGAGTPTTDPLHVFVFFFSSYPSMKGFFWPISLHPFDFVLKGRKSSC